MKNMLSLSAEELDIIDQIAQHSQGIVILNVDNNEEHIISVLNEVESIINNTVSVKHFDETFIIDRPHNKIDVIGTLPNVIPENVVGCVQQICKQSPYIITTLASYNVMCNANS